MEFNRIMVKSILSKASELSSHLEVTSRIRYQVVDLVNKCLKDEAVTDQLVNSLESVFNTAKSEVLTIVGLVQVRHSKECEDITNSINDLEDKDIKFKAA